MWVGEIVGVLGLRSAFAHDDVASRSSARTRSGRADERSAIGWRVSDMTESPLD